jgi:microcystin-dependent protein
METKDIILIILVIIIIYLIYNTKKSEHFYNDAALNAAINNKYKIDMDAMRNLAQISKDILTKGDSLTLPANTTTAALLKLTDGLDTRKAFVHGDTTIGGNLIVNGKVTFNSKDNLLMSIIPKGFIMAHYAGYEPPGWAPCTGGTYKLRDDGIAYWDPAGTKTPDLRSRFIIGSPGAEAELSKIDTIWGEGGQLKPRLYGSMGGQEEVTLTVAQMPSHRHTFGRDFRTSDEPNTGGADCDNDDGSNDLWGITASAGGDQPHNNMPPYFSLKYYMKL